MSNNKRVGCKLIPSGHFWSFSDFLLLGLIQATISQRVILSSTKYISHTITTRLEIIIDYGNAFEAAVRMKMNLAFVATENEAKCTKKWHPENRDE